MKAEHKKWADHVINGKQYTEAYLLVFPNASKKTAANQIGTFKKNVGIMDYIQEGLNRIAVKVEAKVTEKLSEVAIGNVLTSAKKRELLAAIALGELEYEKMVLVKDPESGKMVWRKMLVKPDLHERMKALDLDNKMSGDTYRAKPPELAGDTSKEDLDDLFKNTTFVFRSSND
jgi:hypothetical protein